MIWSNGIIVSKFSRFTAQQLCKNYCLFQSLAISFLWTKFLYFATKAGSWGIPIKLSQLYEGPWGRLMARSWHLRIIGGGFKFWLKIYFFCSIRSKWYMSSAHWAPLQKVASGLNNKSEPHLTGGRLKPDLIMRASCDLWEQAAEQSNLLTPPDYSGFIFWLIFFCIHEKQMMYEQLFRRLQVVSITWASHTSHEEGWNQTLLWEQAAEESNL